VTSTGKQDVVERLTGIGTYEWRLGPDRMTWSDQVFRILGYEPGEIEPDAARVIELAHPEDREQLRKLIGDQLQSPYERTHVWRTVTPDGEVRVVLGIVAAIRSHSSGLPTLIGILQDITSQQLKSRELAAYDEVSKALAAWESRDDPVADVLGAVATALDWAAGALLVPDRNAELLQCVAFWSRPGLDATELESAMRSFRFPATATNAGGYMAERPLVVDDIGSDSEFLHRDPALRVGLRSRVLFPVMHGDQTLAIAELFSERPQTLDDELETTLQGIGRTLGESLAWRRASLEPTMRLTAREREVLQLAASGYQVRQCAKELSITAATIRSHFRNIYEKLGVSDRASAVAEAMRLGLID